MPPEQHRARSHLSAGAGSGRWASGSWSLASDSSPHRGCASMAFEPNPKACSRGQHRSRGYSPLSSGANRSLRRRTAGGCYRRACPAMSSTGGFRAQGANLPPIARPCRRREESDGNQSPRERDPSGTDARIEGRSAVCAPRSPGASRARSALSGSLMISQMTGEGRRRYAPSAATKANQLRGR